MKHLKEADVSPRVFRIDGFQHVGVPMHWAERASLL